MSNDKLAATFHGKSVPVQVPQPIPAVDHLGSRLEYRQNMGQHVQKRQSLLARIWKAIW